MTPEIRLLRPADDLVARFAACTLPKADWTHQAHLTVGMWHVHRHGTAGALPRLRVGIRRLNDSHGTPNTENSGYHETITKAYVQLLAAFLERCPDELPFSERVARLLASPLAHQDALLAFYSRDLLTSARARAEWVEPDLRALGWTDGDEAMRPRSLAPPG